MRVAYFTDTFLPEINGVTNTLYQLSNYLCENNIENIFFAPNYESECIPQIKSRVEKFRGIKPSMYPECVLSFPSYRLHKSKIESFAPDIIHITTPLGIGHFGLRYAREYQIPVVMSYHTNFDRYLKFYDLEFLEHMLWGYLKWFYEKADIVLCPSNDTMLDLADRGFNKLGIWSRGIDADKFSPKHKNPKLRATLGNEGELLFLYVGRIAAEKNLDTLLESIELVNMTHSGKAKFIFTGDGPYMETLKSKNIPNIIMTGQKKGRELSEIYASCDAFVFPSGTETFGNVLLEAMASGLPSLCVNSGGVLDFAKDNVNSLICRCRDKTSIAEGIIKLIENEALRKKLAGGGLLTANAKSWNLVFGGLIQNYINVIVGSKKMAV